jgi:large subunit ribosomal protein L19
MSMELMKKAVATQLRKDFPQFTIGDSVDVSVRIVEGEKERVQIFSGVVTSRRGYGMSEAFTVRRIVNNEGVERTFPLNSPKLAGLTVVRGGKVRRAKLYYLRDRVGKATRLREIRTEAAEAAPAAAAPAAEAPAAAETPKA